MKERIRTLRKEANLTQEQLAKALGYQTATIISMWENGERMPPTSKLPALARLLRCSISDLFAADMSDDRLLNT